MSAPLCQSVIDWEKYYWACQMADKYALSVDYSKYLNPSNMRKFATGAGAHEGSLPKPTTKHQE